MTKTEGQRSGFANSSPIKPGWGQFKTRPEPTFPQSSGVIRVDRLIELNLFAAGTPGVNGPQTDHERELVEEILQEDTETDKPMS